MEHLEKRLLGHTPIKEFTEYYREKGKDDKVKVTSSSIRLVGGAIVDVLKGNSLPKDYDFVDWHDRDIDKFVDAGFVYQHETKTAITYRRDKITVQFLFTKTTDFDFKISQASLRLNNKKLTIDKISYENKILIPISYTDKKMILASLSRIPHWKKKGYQIKEATYLSLINALRNVKSKGS